MSRILTVREVVLAKSEVTYNTDPTPGATDAILVENPSWSNEGLRMIERPAVKPTLGPKKSIYGGKLETITFTCEIKYSGTAGTAPEIDALLKACGLGVTNVPATSDTYAPASSSIGSCTIYYYQDGTRKRLTGCRGNAEFVLTAGDKGMINFTLTGHATTRTDTALITPTYDAELPSAVLSGAFTIDSFSGIISKLQFDLGNTLSMRPSVSAADGYGEIIIANRNVTGSIDPEDELVATEDWYGNFESGASMALSLGAIGPDAGSKYTITMPAVTYLDVSQADREGVRSLELPFQAVESSGDDQVSLAFT